MIKKIRQYKELILVVEDRVGELLRVSKALADRGINILAISAQVAGSLGVINMVVDDHLRGKDLLSKKKMSFRENSVLLIEVEDKPGVLKELARKIQAKRVSIQNIYGSALSSYEGCLLVLSTTDNAKAHLALRPKK